LASQTNQPVWLLDYDLAGDGATAVFGPGSNFPAAGPPAAGHVVLLFDWGPESNEDSRWWAEAAGDALFALTTGLGIHSPRNQSGVTTQFIGHSFGTVTTTEAVERLAAYHVPVDQVTLIDPHDFDQADVPTYDEAQAMSELGAPTGYGATIWNNVGEADVYYQTRGNQDFLVSFGTADPEGRPIPGAYNRHLDGSDELPSGNPYSFGSLASDHGYAWNTFYLSTVAGTRVAGGIAPANPSFDYTQTGWAHSVHNADRVPMPAANFYAGDQDHEHSSPQLVTGAGLPNAAGLAQLGLTSQQIVEGRFAPQFAPGNIVNGNFSSGHRENASVDLVAGWSHHGGGGDSEMQTPGDAVYLQLDSNDVSRTHNYNYIPVNAYELVYDYRVLDPSGDDQLQVTIGNQIVAQQSLATTTPWQTARIAIPAELRDSVSTFGLELTFGSNVFDSPEVDFDNFRYEMAQPLLASNVPVGETIDLGQLWLGESLLVGSALSLSNVGHTQSVLDLLRASILAPADSPDWSLIGLDERLSMAAGDAAVELGVEFAGSLVAGHYESTLTMATGVGSLEWLLKATVVDRYAGDFNADGVVDAADYTVWRDALGSMNAAVDVDRSGVVDAGDYTIWRNQFGLTSGSLAAAAAAVPEPSAMVVLLLAGGFVTILSGRCKFDIYGSQHV
jgi:hypothetical protein